MFANKPNVPQPMRDQLKISFYRVKEKGIWTQKILGTVMVEDRLRSAVRREKTFELLKAMSA